MDNDRILKPTHKISFYGLRCYYDDREEMMWGTNCVFDLLIEPVCHVHNFLSIVTEFMCPHWESSGFPIKILEEYKREGE